jgi:signal transduction histidine kinase
VLARLTAAEDPAGKASRNAEIIQRFSARMNRLIGDLLDVASIEAGKLAVDPERHDAVRLCRESMDAFQLAASAQGIQFTCQSGADSLVAEFDHERILQVLTNLVGNALKFTAKGGHITVRVDRRGNDVCFAVEDTGEGIPSDRLEKIFDRFFQSHGSDRRGLGLGLFIAKSLVEAHAGRIWAESVLGRGTTFFFTLPLRRAPGLKVSGPSRHPAG